MIPFNDIKTKLSEKLGISLLKESIGRTISVDRKPFDDEFKKKALTATLFGEGETEQFRDIGSVISNRVKQTGKDVLDVLGTGFDAVGGEQFSKVFSGDLDEPSRRKLAEAESVADEVISGKFKPTTNANFFRHENGKFITEFKEGNILTATPEEMNKFEAFRGVETKTTEGTITQAVNKLRSFDIKEVNQFLDELPILGNVRKFMKKLQPKSDEEALEQGMINLGTKDSPLYFDFTGAVGSLKNVGKEGAKQVLKKALPKLKAVTEELPGNLKRLNVSQGVKEHLSETINQIKPELETLKGGILKNEEVVEAAKKSSLLIRNVSKEATLKSEAALLRTRQHLAELAKGNTITKDFVDTLKVVSSEATQRGRELQALGIEADPALGSIKTKIVKELLKIGQSVDDIVRESQGVDFTDAKQVQDFYRKFVKPSLPEIIDEYRYINLLSSPKTHIVNAFSNLLQVAGLRPATRLASGVLDAIGSKLTGKAQEYYVSQVPAYYKGAINSLGDATNSFLKAMRGESILYRPDITQIPTGLKMFKPFQVIPRILEASDVFFRTLATSGEIESLMSKGLTEAQAIQKATNIASELVFRKALDPSNKTGQGLVLSSIDKLTNAVYGLRKVPGVKWFVPFVQTPMNILKQGVEYSPLGITTLPQNADKIEQLGKTMVGSTVFMGAGWLALNDRTTWSVPTSQKERELFYAAGKQPYSVKFGDKWFSYSRLGPLSYPIAMAAAIKFHTDQNPSAVVDTDLQKITKILSGIAKYFSDQSYVEGIGDFVALAQGDTTAPVQIATAIPSQLIPLSSLQRWIANIVDPIYRKSETTLSVENIIKNLEKGIPFLSKNLEPYKTPFGQESRRQYPVAGAISPVAVTKESPTETNLLNLIQDKKRLDLIKKDLQEKLKQRIVPNL